MLFHFSAVVSSRSCIIDCELHEKAPWHNPPYRVEPDVYAQWGYRPPSRRICTSRWKILGGTPTVDVVLLFEGGRVGGMRMGQMTPVGALRRSPAVICRCASSMHLRRPSAQSSSSIRPRNIRPARTHRTSDQVVEGARRPAPPPLLRIAHALPLVPRV